MSKGLNIGLGIDFQPGSQDGLINNRGVDMIHEIGLACPCRAEDVYEKFSNTSGVTPKNLAFCTKCEGSGYLFRSPSKIKGIFTNVSFQRNILETGMVAPGDALFSPTYEREGSASCADSGRKIGSFDKLTSLWPEPISDGQVIVRGAGASLAEEGIETYLSANEDRLWYLPAKAIWCEDFNGVVYQDITDFELGSGRIIRWVGNSPAEGVPYTIKYEGHFEWIVFQPPKERQDRQGDLGNLIYLRKKHVVHVNDSPATSEDKEYLLGKVKL